MMKAVAPMEAHSDALLRALAQFGVVVNGGDPPGCDGTGSSVVDPFGVMMTH